MTTEQEQFYEKWKAEGPQSLPLTREESKTVSEAAAKIAIQKAAREKGQKLYNQIYGLMVENTAEYPEFSAQDWQDCIVQIGNARAQDVGCKNGFQVDIYNQSIIKLLALYFSNSGGFETLVENYSLRKGILLIGGVGTGKTQLMQINAVNPKLCYSVNDCANIANEYSKSGANVIEKYSKTQESPVPARTFGQRYITQFFDDLGAEDTGKHYGSQKNVMGDIIQNLYQIFERGGNAPHFTTNLMPDEIEQFYGVRVADRLHGMCNILIYPSNAINRRRQ